MVPCKREEIDQSGSMSSSATYTNMGTVVTDAGGMYETAFATNPKYESSTGTSTSVAVQINPHYQNEVVAAQGTLQAAVQYPYASFLLRPQRTGRGTMVILTGLMIQKAMSTRWWCKWYGGWSVG